MGKQEAALFVCTELPYPITKGIQIRQATQIEALAEQQDVTVVTTHMPRLATAEPLEVPPRVRVEIWPMDFAPPQPSAWRRLFSLAPYYVTHPRLREFHRNRLLRLLGSSEFGLIWVSRLKCAWTLGDLGGIPSVLDLDEEEVKVRRKRLSLMEDRSLLERLATRLDLQRLQHIERHICDQFTLVTLSSPLELARVNLAQARLLPNCPPAQAELVNQYLTEADRLLFIGTLEYDPNLHGLRWFLRHVWPRLRSSYPNATLDVIGEGGDGCLDIQAISGVQVHGYVPNPQAFWERAALAIVPVFAGGGTRIKILDAWQRGVPVVSTSIGVEGLDALPGEHLLIADRPDEFACACEKLLGSRCLGEQIAQRAAALIEMRYTRKRIKGLVRDIAREARYGQVLQADG